MSERGLMAVLAKNKALERIQQAAGRFPHKAVTYARDGIEALRCRGCGTLLRGLVEHPDDARVERLHGGRTVAVRRMVMQTLAAYTQRTIVFDDGSRHVTLGCASCLDQLKPDQLEAWYAADLAEFIEAEQRGDGPVRWDLMAERKPLGLLKVEG